MPLSEVELEASDDYELETLKLNNKELYFVEVDAEQSEVMSPVLKSGDKLLASLTEKPKSGDIVIVTAGGLSAAVRILQINPNNSNELLLLGANQATRPIFINREDAVVHKVVMIKKK